MNKTPKELVKEIVKILDDKKADDITVIGVTNVTIIADYFVICSASSTTKSP
jgi:ribosome-associated protein